MASDLRSEWQKAKKTSPAFTKIKVKADLGPMLDQFDKERAKFSKVVNTPLTKQVDVMTKLSVRLENAVNTYRNTIKKSIGISSKDKATLLKTLDHIDQRIKSLNDGSADTLEFYADMLKKVSH